VVGAGPSACPASGAATMSEESKPAMIRLD